MIFAIFFEILLMLFHSANSFQIVNGNDEDFLTFRGHSVYLNAKADDWYRVCRLMKKGVQLCKLTLHRTLGTQTIPCETNGIHVTYKREGYYKYVCEFAALTLQENGNKIMFFLSLSNNWHNFFHSIYFVLL
jgi:hypothetical protein